MVIDDRIAERRADIRESRRRSRLRRTLWIVAAVTVAVALVLVERSALVGLEEVRVAGVDLLEAGEVRQAAGLELGTSTLRLGLAGAAERVERLPLVRDAEARRLDPLTVLIEVIEREPVLEVSGDGESRLVDRDGVVILEGGDDALAQVRLPDAPPAVGEPVREDATLANAHRVWRELSGPLRALVERFDADGPDELSLHLSTGVEVRFGRAERVDEKVRALGAVLEDVGDTPVEVIDVRAPRAPVVIAP